MQSPAQANAQPSATPAVAQAETVTHIETVTHLKTVVQPEMRSEPAAQLDPDALTSEALTVELPEELSDLREMGQDIGDRLSEIDPKVIQQVMRPLGRQALQIFLDSAPALSQKAIELGEQGLAELERRALEGLEQAQTDLEQNELSPSL